MKASPAGLLFLILTVSAMGIEELPVVVADSGSKEVDELVAGLVSRRPAPISIGAKIPRPLRQKVMFMSRYATEQVESSIQSLNQLGPASFPHLLAHLDDERYSYSTLLPSRVGAGNGWMNQSVGEAIYQVLSKELCWAGGYKLRDGPDGKSFPAIGFGEFVETRGGLRKWVAEASRKSRIEVYTEVIDWCVAEERKRGFADSDDEKRIMGNLDAKRKAIEQD